MSARTLLLGLVALAFVACEGAQLTAEQIKALPGCENADTQTYLGKVALPACTSWLQTPKNASCPAECDQGLTALGEACLVAVTTYEWQQKFGNVPANLTKVYVDSLLSACANGTASGVDESQATDLLKYLNHPSCSSADLKGALAADCDVETLLTAIQSSKNCSAGCTKFITSIGVECLADAFVQLFNETQPGMMGFSEATVRQLFQQFMKPCIGNATSPPPSPAPTGCPESGGWARDKGDSVCARVLSQCKKQTVPSLYQELYTFDGQDTYCCRCRTGVQLGGAAGTCPAGWTAGNPNATTATADPCWQLAVGPCKQAGQRQFSASYGQANCCTCSAAGVDPPLSDTSTTGNGTSDGTGGGGGGGGSNTGAAVGAAVGAVAAVAVVSVVLFILYRRWHRRRQAMDAAGKSAPAGLAAPSFGPTGSGGSGYGLGPGGSSGESASLYSLQSKTAAAGAALPYLALAGSAGGTPHSTLLPLTSSAPTTPSLPSTSLRSGASADLPPSLSRDPLLSYLSSQAAPRPSGASSSPGLAGVDVGQWEVQFSELQMKRLAGEGSFGKVYLASWFGTEVAVKILIVGHVANASEAQRALSLSAPIMQQLQAEASLLASLRHPQVIRFLGICREPPCIITEFCARGSLCDLLASARSDPEVAAQLTWRRRLAMATDAAAGMLYLHSRSSPAPIIHRDLKSPNLLVDSNWAVKVTDFNLSKILEDSTHSTSMAAMNPRWLAPEVMRGGRATKASDVYSFGIVLHELLTWQLPFGPANPWHLVAHVLAGGRLEIPPREALPGPDTAQFDGLDGYVALMQQCWAQAPEERPNFQQVVQLLRALLEQAPPEQQ